MFTKIIFVLSIFLGTAAFCDESLPVGAISFADTAWLLTSAALVLLMTPGLSFFYGGMVRPKNVVSTMLQSYICMGVVSLFWYLIGFSLVFGESIGGVIGNPTTFFMFKNVGEFSHPALSPTIPLVLYAVFQLKFAIITPALITGSFAERVRFRSYIIFMVLFELFIYSPLAHMTWHPDGILRQMGVLDFAGGTVIHMSAGLAALVGAYFLGSRSQSSNKALSHNPANIPYVLLGTGLLWFGWFGFNAGSSLGANGLGAMAFATTHFASASAMIMWLVMDSFRGRKPSAMGACVGAVVGLVAITPAAGFVSISSSMLIGIIAAAVSHIAVSLRSKSNLDDTLDVFPCHGIGGIVGMILTGVFAKDVGLIAGQTHTFFAHMISLVGVVIGVISISYVLYWLVNKISPMRVTNSEELLGLDISQHNEMGLSLEEVTTFDRPQSKSDVFPHSSPTAA